MQISLVVIDPIDSMLRRATLPHLLAWLKEKANAFDCLIVAAVDDERGELEEAGAMGSSGSVSSCFESVDLVLRFHAPSQSGQSNDNRRGVGREQQVAAAEEPDHAVQDEFLHGAGGPFRQSPGQPAQGPGRPLARLRGRRGNVPAALRPDAGAPAVHVRLRAGSWWP